MPIHNIALGRKAETEAAEFLKSRGYRILKLNYRTALGEIDIIARDREGLVFVEVKSATSEKFGSPCEKVSSFKQRQISKAALKFLKDNRLLDSSARFDVVSALYPDKGAPKFELIKNAFELDARFTF